MDSNRTIVVGLDGAHFELIEPWIADGELPNIAELIDSGVASDMDVCLPPVTSPNWKCYSTGRNPARFGIFWWENIDKEARKVHYPSDRKHELKEIWDYLGEKGHEVCVIGTPLTYPPKDVNGVMIAGGLDSGTEHFTSPASLETKLKEEFDYRVHPEADVRTDPEKAASQIHDLIHTRFEVATYLLEQNDYDFVQITSFYLNVLQHFLWDAEETKEGWKIVDQHLGTLREKYPYANIIVMSDHGSNEIDTVININRWLHENEYLNYTWRYSLAQKLDSLGITKESLDALVSQLGIKPIAERLAPDAITEAVPNEGGEFKQEAKTDIVDWESSTAIASGQGPVYVLDQDKKAELKQDLESFTVGGERPFRSIYDQKELFNGKYLDEAPDLVVDQNANVHVRGELGSETVVDEPDKNVWRADNKRTGLFIGDGPDISEVVSESISILDLAPTILDLYGINPPKDMDGDTLLN